MDTARGVVIKRVHVADAAGARPRIVLERTSSTFGIAILFSPDSRKLAVVDTWDDVLAVVDVESGAKESEISAGAQYAWPLAFTPDGNAIVLRDGKDNHVLRTVRWRDGAALAETTIVGDYASAAGDGTIVTHEGAVAHVYRGGALLTTMPAIDDLCFGFIPYTFLSDDGSVVGLGESCSRSWYLREPPHADIRQTATGAFIQQVAAEQPLVFASDASMFADASGLIWCR